MGQKAMRLGEWNGEICIVDEWTMDEKPTRVIAYWPTGIRAFNFYRNWGEDLKGAPARYTGRNGIYELMPPGRNEKPIQIQLVRGGQTYAIHTDNVPYPCPKVKKGMQTRYFQGDWWKYLKSKGWTRIYD